MKNRYNIYNEDCLSLLKDLPPESVHSMVTDPPAGINLLNLDWDSSQGGYEPWILWAENIFLECMKVLKPGAYGFVWAIPKTSHRTAMALERSGFIVKDVLTHVYGTGFPKNQYISDLITRSKRLDLSSIYRVTEWVRSRKHKLGLTNREIDKFVGSSGAAVHWITLPPNPQAQIPSAKKWKKLLLLVGESPEEISTIVKAYHDKNQSPEALSPELIELKRKWAGWGTSLKPASEHWILVQKPIEKNNLASNINHFDVGALNIDDSRIKSHDLSKRTKDIKSKSPFSSVSKDHINKVDSFNPHANGRFPSNFMFSDKKTENQQTILKDRKKARGYFKSFTIEAPYIYAKKPDKDEKGPNNNHPTVKPIALLSYLINMVTPKEGIVLDPFMGSGTVGVCSVLEGFRYIGVEKEPEYFDIAKKRIRGAHKRTKNGRNPIRDNDTGEITDKRSV